MYYAICSALGFLAGVFSVYLTAYSKQKGQNHALTEDINRLEEEKQRIAAKYQAELEEVKKSNTLEIEVRKHKYEEKKKQFVKFFEALDSFHERSNLAFQEDFFPIMNKFMVNHISASSQYEQNESLKAFLTELNPIFSKLNQESIRLKSETNSIRLVSSQDMESLLNNLEHCVEKATSDATAMLKFMATPEFMLDQSLLKPHQDNAISAGQNVLLARNQLRDQMKYELNSI